MTQPGERRLIARVHGRVQGVGFRAFVIHEARRLSLTGWTRNCPDGTVETVAEGPEEKLRQFRGLLARGPAAAVVERVDSDWADPTGEFHGFNVRF